MEHQTGVTKAEAYKDEPLQGDTHQSEPLPHKDAAVGNQSPQESISKYGEFFHTIKKAYLKKKIVWLGNNGKGCR